jgi:hypothetical protein
VHLNRYSEIAGKLAANEQLADLITHLAKYPIWNNAELMNDAEEISRQIFDKRSKD